MRIRFVHRCCFDRVWFGIDCLESQPLHEVSNTVTTNVDAVFIVQLNVHPSGAVKRIPGIDFINSIHMQFVERKALDTHYWLVVDASAGKTQKLSLPAHR